MQETKWKWKWKVKVKVTQLCLTLWPHDYTVHGILQARTLEWVAFPFSRGSSNAGIEPRSPALLVDSLPAEPQEKPRRHKGCGFDPGIGRSPGRGNGSPLQYSCLENSTNREIWQPTLHRVTKSQTWLKQPSMHVHMHAFSCVSHSVVSSSLWPHGLSPPRLLCPWNSTFVCPVSITGT